MAMNLNFNELEKHAWVFFLFGFLVGVFLFGRMIELRYLRAALIGPISSEIEDMTINVSDTVTLNSASNDLVELSFSADVDSAYNSETFVDGYSFELVYAAGLNPTNPSITLSDGVLFDSLNFVDLMNGSRKITITVYSLNLNDDQELFTFKYQLADFTEHSVLISAEALTVSENVYDLGSLSYLIEEPEVVEEEVEPTPVTTPSGGGGGGANYVKIARNSGSSGSKASNGEAEKVSEGYVCSDQTYDLDAHGFPDIDGHYGEYAISIMSQRGDIKGYDDGFFRPDKNVSRAEFTKMVLEAFDCVMRRTDFEPFPDVPSYAWYRDYIYSAKISSIVDGYPDGLFRPENEITRAEGLKILLEAANIDLDHKWQGTFNDVPEYAWYYDYVEKAYEMRLVQGYEGGLFGPDDPLTRAQAAIMLVNLDCHYSVQCR